MPVNNVENGMSESCAPLRVKRSGGIPEKSKSIALSAAKVMNKARPNKRMPENVSQTAMARNPLHIA